MKNKDILKKYNILIGFIIISMLIIGIGIVLKENFYVDTDITSPIIFSGMMLFVSSFSILKIKLFNDLC